MSTASDPSQPGTAPRDPRDAVFDVSDMIEGAGRRAGSAGILLLLFAGLKFGIQIAGIAILARLIPPSEYGVVALAMPVVIVMTNVSGMGLGEAIVQRPHVTHRLANALFWINAALGLASGAFLMALGPFAADFFDEPRVAPVFLALGIIAIVSALNVQFTAVLRRRMRISVIENVNVFANALALVAAVIAALAGLSYWAIIVQAGIVPAVMIVCFVIYAGWRPSAPWDGDWREVRGAVGFGGALTVYNFLARATNSASTLMVGRLFDVTSAGLYLRAQNAASLLPTRFVASLSGAFLPTLARLQDDPPAFNVMFRRMVTRTHAVIMPIGILVAVGSDPVIRILMGPEWAAAAPLMAIFSVLILQAPLSRGINWAMVASGRTGWMLIFGIIVTITSLLALWTGAQYGIVMMATAHMMVMLAVRLPLLLGLALRVSPLEASALRAPLADGLLAGVIIAALLLLQPAFPEMVAVLELLVLALIIGALWGLRVLLDRGMRKDVLKVFEIVTARMRKQRA